MKNRTLCSQLPVAIGVNVDGCLDNYGQSGVFTRSRKNAAGGGGCRASERSESSGVRVYPASGIPLFTHLPVRDILTFVCSTESASTVVKRIA